MTNFIPKKISLKPKGQFKKMKIEHSCHGQYQFHINLISKYNAYMYSTRIINWTTNYFLKINNCNFLNKNFLLRHTLQMLKKFILTIVFFHPSQVIEISKSLIKSFFISINNVVINFSSLWILYLRKLFVINHNVLKMRWFYKIVGNFTT